MFREKIYSALYNLFINFNEEMKSMNKLVNYFGDAFTKIGGGIFGGTIVSFYYNKFVLNNPSKDLLSIHLFFIAFGLLLLIGGYVCIYRSERKMSTMN